MIGMYRSMHTTCGRSRAAASTSLRAVLALAHDAEVGFTGEHLDQPQPGQRMVIDDEHADVRRGVADVLRPDRDLPTMQSVADLSDSRSGELDEPGRPPLLTQDVCPRIGHEGGGHSEVGQAVGLRRVEDRVFEDGGHLLDITEHAGRVATGGGDLDLFHAQ